jgi:hypothetical protein
MPRGLRFGLLTTPGGPWASTVRAWRWSPAVEELSVTGPVPHPHHAGP